MGRRWLILGVLFLARATMAYQYQAVAALAPFVIDSYFLTVADIGILIGLYLGPGLVVAIPGGSLAARFGDRKISIIALAMMMAGGALMWAGGGWWALVAGRVLAGAGGVIVNIVMTKMLVDWFAGREIGTAMGLFLSSWPAGIALALLTLPGIATWGGLGAAWAAVVVVTGLALALFALVYRTAPRTETATGSSWAIPVLALSLAAAVWGFYNAALAMVFSFGPLILNARGLEPAAAGWMVSLFIIGVGVGAPLGGLLADKTGRRDQVIGGCLLGYLVLVPLVPVLPDKALPGLFAATGLILGSGAGQIMTLPSAVLSPASRAFGMGVFFAIYYLTMLVAPTVAGALADWTGNAIWALWLGVGMIGLTGLALAVFRRVARGVPA